MVAVIGDYMMAGAAPPRWLAQQSIILACKLGPTGKPWVRLPATTL